LYYINNNITISAAARERLKQFEGQTGFGSSSYFNREENNK